MRTTLPSFDHQVITVKGSFFLLTTLDWRGLTWSYHLCSSSGFSKHSHIFLVRTCIPLSNELLSTILQIGNRQLAKMPIMQMVNLILPSRTVLTQRISHNGE